MKPGNLETWHDNSTTNAALASALETYGDLADELRDEQKDAPQMEVCGFSRSP